MKLGKREPVADESPTAPADESSEANPLLNDRSLIFALTRTPEKVELEAPVAPGPHQETAESQAHTRAPEIEYSQGRQEVVCARCFAQALPKRRLAGANILELLVASAGAILAGVVLVLLTNPTAVFDVPTQTWVTVEARIVPWWWWAIGLPLGLIPAVGYHYWRVRRGRWVCLSCGETNIWPAHSPVARALIAHHTSRVPAYPFE